MEEEAKAADSIITHIEWAKVKDEELVAMVDLLRKAHKSISIPMLQNEDGAYMVYHSFECRRCGRCCIAPSGSEVDIGIRLTDREMTRLADLKGMSRRKFKRRYCVTAGGCYYMRYPCPFYDKGKVGKVHGCTVYSNRPIVCVQFPLTVPNIQGELFALAAYCDDAAGVAVDLYRMLAAEYRRLNMDGAPPDEGRGITFCIAREGKEAWFDVNGKEVPPVSEEVGRQDGERVEDHHGQDQALRVPG
jgi:Fe-S-cluster containining protein